MDSIAKFGTIGFLSLLLAAQTALYAESVSDKTDRAYTDAKKSARSFKSQAKKAGRKATGNDSKIDDAKDNVGDAAGNAKDELNYQKRHYQRKQ